MDTKNDDSGGSDSLDKSLQKKCVVDDVGQGEGSTSGQALTATAATQRTAADGLAARAGNSTKKQKTEKQVGDGNSGSGSGGTVSGCGTSNTANDTENDCCTTNKQQISNKQLQQDDKTHAAVHTMKPSEDTSSSSTSKTGTASNEAVPTSSSATAISLPTSASITSSTNNCKIEAANCNNNNSNNAFETKVKQISKNLKETTLAETTTLTATASETATTTTTTSTLPTSNSEQNNVDESTSASSSTPSTSSTPTASTTTSPDGTNTTINTEEQGGDGAAMNSSMISDSNDDADSRSKKVRFHPDVKENDGGNRVIPKKKKKLKANAGGVDGASTSAQAGEEMDLDEEDDCEEDDEFDLAKTIAEAQDYLKEHPLTFVRPCDKSAGRLQNGLLEEEDIQHLESSEEEEFIDAVIPENGIERILGKQTKGGRVEFLLRFTNQPGLFWESEDFIATQCPSLLTQYEFNRERRQERLMRHVAKRQNLRQRYTDF